MAAELLDPTSQGSNLKPEEIIDAIEFICQIATNLKYDLGEVRSEIADFRDRKGLWSKSFVWKRDSVSTISPLICGEVKGHKFIKYSCEDFICSNNICIH